MNFKFGMDAPKENPDMTAEIFFEKARGRGHVTPFFGR